ncbi:uncharacterized protein LOC123316775 [Coccinella septempunctata]|uniref:uncharacterized protein LOC123316775 n=1 Tax=Coccinella septempunctata TaxID=41139 RepID=UPI001D081D3F|nr:uncharacterized protein LOC123316775 [Coccinella septempunctata]
MSEVHKCPFCDSSEEKTSERNLGSWEDTSEIICGYFPNFTNDHFKDLCNSCFDYISEFCKCRKLWIDNEKMIHAKRLLGQFKGLKDIVTLKKNSSVVCRLCFKESRFEDVIFVYLDHKKYQPGYIQNIMFLHANDIDFKLTENPVICQECLDAVQTFDALYQMCVENQASKAKPDLHVKTLCNYQHQNLDNEKVHVQLKKNKDSNTLVLQPVTEAESAVNCLMRTKETLGSNVVMNGWTTRKVFNLVTNPKFEEKKKSPDILEISDEEDVACSATSRGSKRPSDDSTYEGNLEFRSSSNDAKKMKIGSSKESTKCMGEAELEHPSSQPVVIEIDDSDEENLDFPKILSVTSLNESVGTQLQYDILEEGEILPSMQAVNMLFNHNNTPSELNSVIQESSSTDSYCCEMTSENFSSNSNNSHQPEVLSKDLLEDDLSDFLQFNKSGTDSSKRSKDLLDDDGSIEKVAEPPSDCTNTVFHQNDPKTYSSVFEQFVLLEKVASTRATAWKLLRGFLSDDIKEEYCTWFPFVPKNRKNYPSTKRKSHLTTLENCLGRRIYRCDVCLHVMNDESQATIHQCINLRGRKSRVCAEPKCGFYTFNDYLFAQHKKAHTLLSREDIQRYRCDFCDQYSSHKECLAKHQTLHKKVEIKGTVTKCKFCFFESPNPDILAHHQAVRHSYKKSKFTEKHFS